MKQSQSQYPAKNQHEHPPLPALLDCKGLASGVSAYVDALEEDRLRGVAGRGLARESMRGVWIVAREYKDRVEVGCEYPNPRLGGQKGAAAR
ncbi:hypothetical protein ACU4HD_22295 [Cupriavidus basilensis]